MQSTYDVKPPIVGSLWFVKAAGFDINPLAEILRVALHVCVFVLFIERVRLSKGNSFKVTLYYLFIRLSVDTF